MEIPPASLSMIQKGKNGRFIAIEDDVQGVVNAINEIDHHFRVRYSEAGEYYVIYWLPDGWEEGDGYLITTRTEFDHRLVNEVGEIYQRCQAPGYSFADELERTEAEAQRQKDHEFKESHGEMYEQMAYAMRHDLGYHKQRAFIPKEIASV